MPFSSHAVLVLAAGSTGSTPSKGNSLLSLLPLLLIAVVGYLLLIRPARTRQRRALEQRAAVEVGAEVTTTAGLLARVVDVDDETVTLEIAPGVHSRFVKGAIARVHTPDEPEPESADEPRAADGGDDAPGVTGSAT